MKKEKLVLACPICKELNEKPLSADSETTYGPDWVKIAAYMEAQELYGQLVKMIKSL